MAIDTVGASLEALLKPSSIAVVGASANVRSQGHEFVQGLVENKFPGPVYPVNPKLEELLGLKCYPRLDAVPGDVDYVISAVPATYVLELVEQAKAKRVKLIHFFTARFGETGHEGAAELERELSRRTREAGIRVIGPNCMGLYYPKAGITFDAHIPMLPGNIGFLSQSGSHAFRVIQRGRDRGLGFTKVISYGNALDLSEVDFLDLFADDPETEIIAAYIEGMRDGRRLFQALRRAAAKKPVVVMKGGRTVAGHAAASSHTAALAGERTIWSTAVRQAGALEVWSLNEFIDMLVAFRNVGPAKGLRVAVTGGAGGGTVEAADICAEAGLVLEPIPQDIREKIKERVPEAWDWVGNPIDGSILMGLGLRDTELIEMMAAHPAYDAVIANLQVEWTMNTPDDDTRYREVIEKTVQLAKGNGKATMIVLGEPESLQEWRRNIAVRARRELGEAGVAVFSDIERAAGTMARYAQYMLEREDRCRTS